MKFQECPYKTLNGKCVHKHCEYKRKRKKRFCAHKEAKECEMYNEWLELITIDKDGSMDELELFDTEGES